MTADEVRLCLSLALDEVTRLRAGDAGEALSAVRECVALLSEALPEIEKRSPRRAARFRVLLVKLRALGGVA